MKLNLEYMAGFPVSDETFLPKTLAFIGHKETLVSESFLSLVPPAALPLYSIMVEKTKGGEQGGHSTSWMMDEEGTQLFVGVLPASCSRHNSAAQPHAVTKLVKALEVKDDVALVLGLTEADHALACACACARAFPLFSRKTGDEDSKKAPTVRVGLTCTHSPVELHSLAQATYAAQGVRTAARIVDTPPMDMTTTQFVQEASVIADRLEGVNISIVKGEDLKTMGFGGIYGVGKAAEEPPAFVHLSYEQPEKSAGTKTVVLVGKGIVYDTGGLSIKTPTPNMCGMKSDCGGAAAVLAAFEAAVASGTPHNLHCCLCLAENAIGNAAFRNDDILTLFSGKTVEINNTDAEGRLVLGDGVAWASKKIKADVILDMATLTGAQLIATGKRHCAVVSNTDELESYAVSAGKASGDLAHPLPFCPEFYSQEFKSVVADMKNSVKDRMNAQSSCAGTFIYNHLDEDYKGGWLHCDIAGPSFIDERGTGYGVALILELLKRL
ncbi:hypothetical protein CYMTET_37625 [Cymbomonas tetramitiformis]|uniref:Cytosol aminopeptidase domain-containing protein n=1 Tax=Cymbomonas tetramitiformis TaxID=36881 RepID=A0AAE0CDJ8_9CHLO|nr:hypothetical protein CYMTET_37625 [Cymbomonas tetramitiformis]|eukprot:gene9383-11119_t